MAGCLTEQIEYLEELVKIKEKEIKDLEDKIKELEYSKEFEENSYIY